MSNSLLPFSECRLQMPNPHDAVGALQPGFLFTEYQERLGEAFTKAMQGLWDNGGGLYWLVRALKSDPHYPSCTSKGKSHLIFSS